MAEAPIGHLAARACRIPTDAPEADGTLAWNATTVVVVEIAAGGAKGLGYTFADAASAQIALHVLADAICGIDAFAIPRAWAAMVAAVRNIGWRGVSASAISAVDVALWDLKSRLLAVPLTRLLGQLRDEVPVYGSGGFTSYSIERLQQQLAAWTQHDGCRWVKMKVGTAPDEDVNRVSAAREVIGEASLYVDANGAYARKQALALANEFADLGVVWFEEPVSSDDREGLRHIRDRSPAGIEIAAGEYG
jgi:L-alanine-DL-glutamate epimerase-like enolase superfamily enzyme